MNCTVHAVHLIRLSFLMWVIKQHESQMRAGMCISSWNTVLYYQKLIKTNLLVPGNSDNNSLVYSTFSFHLNEGASYLSVINAFMNVFFIFCTAFIRHSNFLVEYRVSQVVCWCLSALKTFPHQSQQSWPGLLLADVPYMTLKEATAKHTNLKN